MHTPTCGERRIAIGTDSVGVVGHVHSAAALQSELSLAVHHDALAEVQVAPVDQQRPERRGEAVPGQPEDAKVPEGGQGAHEGLAVSRWWVAVECGIMTGR